MIFDNSLITLRNTFSVKYGTYGDYTLIYCCLKNTEAVNCVLLWDIKLHNSVNIGRIITNQQHLYHNVLNKSKINIDLKKYILSQIWFAIYNDKSRLRYALSYASFYLPICKSAVQDILRLTKAYYLISKLESVEDC